MKKLGFLNFNEKLGFLLIHRFSLKIGKPLHFTYTENIKIILTFAFFRSRQCFLSTFRHLLQDARSMSDFCPKRRMWIRSLQSFKTNTDFVMCLRKWVQKLFEIPTACILFGWNTYHVDWTFTGKSTLFLISIHPKSY